MRTPKVGEYYIRYEEDIAQNAIIRILDVNEKTNVIKYALVKLSWHTSMIFYAPHVTSTGTSEYCLCDKNGVLDLEQQYLDPQNYIFILTEIGERDAAFAENDFIHGVFNPRDPGGTYFGYTFDFYGMEPSDGRTHGCMLERINNYAFYNACYCDNFAFYDYGRREVDQTTLIHNLTYIGDYAFYNMSGDMLYFFSHNCSFRDCCQERQNDSFVTAVIGNETSGILSYVGEGAFQKTPIVCYSSEFPFYYGVTSSVPCTIGKNAFAFYHFSNNVMSTRAISIVLPDSVELLGTLFGEDALEVNDQHAFYEEYDNDGDFGIPPNIFRKDMIYNLIKEENSNYEGYALVTKAGTGTGTDHRIIYALTELKSGVLNVSENRGLSGSTFSMLGLDYLEISFPEHYIKIIPKNLFSNVFNGASSLLVITNLPLSNILNKQSFIKDFFGTEEDPFITSGSTLYLRLIDTREISAGYFASMGIGYRFDLELAYTEEDFLANDDFLYLDFQQDCFNNCNLNSLLCVCLDSYEPSNKTIYILANDNAFYKCSVENGFIANTTTIFKELEIIKVGRNSFKLLSVNSGQGLSSVGLSVKLAHTVTKIPEGAFESSTLWYGITTLSIPWSVTQIETRAFWGNYFTEIEIPVNGPSITFGRAAFGYSAILKKVSIPTSRLHCDSNFNMLVFEDDRSGFLPSIERHYNDFFNIYIYNDVLLGITLNKENIGNLTENDAKIDLLAATAIKIVANKLFSADFEDVEDVPIELKLPSSINMVMRYALTTVTDRPAAIKMLDIPFIGPNRDGFAIFGNNIDHNTYYLFHSYDLCPTLKTIKISEQQNIIAGTICAISSEPNSRLHVVLPKAEVIFLGAFDSLQVDSEFLINPERTGWPLEEVTVEFNQLQRMYMDDMYSYLHIIVNKKKWFFKDWESLLTVSLMYPHTNSMGNTIYSDEYPEENCILKAEYNHNFYFFGEDNDVFESSYDEENNQLLVQIGQPTNNIIYSSFFANSKDFYFTGDHVAKRATTKKIIISNGTVTSSSNYNSFWTHLVIPEGGYANLGYNAFKKSDLQEILIKGNVYLGDAFNECELLESFYCSEDSELTIISVIDGPYINAKKIKNIYLGSKLISFPNSPKGGIIPLFDFWPRITEITFASQEVMNILTNIFKLFALTDSDAINHLKEVANGIKEPPKIVLKNITNIPQSFFSSWNIGNFSFGSTLKEIGEGSFMLATFWKDPLEFPETLERIGQRAFYDSVYTKFDIIDLSKTQISVIASDVFAATTERSKNQNLTVIMPASVQVYNRDSEGRTSYVKNLIFTKPSQITLLNLDTFKSGANIWLNTLVPIKPNYSSDIAYKFFVPYTSDYKADAFLTDMGNNVSIIGMDEEEYTSQQNFFGKYGCTNEDFKISCYLYNNQKEALEEVRESTLCYVSTDEWRTELYYRGLESKDKTFARNPYSAELNSEWTKIYDLSKTFVDNHAANEETEIFNADAVIPYYKGGFRDEISQTNYEFWLDFLEGGADLSSSNVPLSQFKISNIGRRTKVVSDNTINCVFAKDLPPYVYTDGAGNTEEFQILAKSKNYTPVCVSNEIANMLTLGGRQKPAFDKMKELLQEHTQYNQQVQLSIVPIYYLEPNTTIQINQNNIGVDGNYLIKTISLPLTFSGTSSISATKSIVKEQWEMTNTMNSEIAALDAGQLDKIRLT